MEASQLARGPGHPFYRRLNQLLDKHDFDAFVEEQCSVFLCRELRPALAGPSEVLPSSFGRLFRRH